MSIDVKITAPTGLGRERVASALLRALKEAGVTVTLNSADYGDEADQLAEKFADSEFICDVPVNITTGPEEIWYREYCDHVIPESKSAEFESWLYDPVEDGMSEAELYGETPEWATRIGGTLRFKNWEK